MKLGLDANLKNASGKLYELKMVIHSEGGYRYSEEYI